MNGFNPYGSVQRLIQRSIKDISKKRRFKNAHIESMKNVREILGGKFELNQSYPKEHVDLPSVKEPVKKGRTRSKNLSLTSLLSNKHSLQNSKTVDTGAASPRNKSIESNKSSQHD